MLEYLDAEQLVPVVPAIAPIPEVLAELRRLCVVKWTERTRGSHNVTEVVLALIN